MATKHTLIDTPLQGTTLTVIQNNRVILNNFDQENPLKKTFPLFFVVFYYSIKRADQMTAGDYGEMWRIAGADVLLA